MALRMFAWKSEKKKIRKDFIDHNKGKWVQIDK